MMKRLTLVTGLALAGLGLTLALLWMLSSFSTGLSVARAASHTVCPAGPPTCDYSAIQAAVDAALDGDVIKIATGVYTDVSMRPSNDTYPSVITQVVYISKSVTLRGGYTTTFAEPPDPNHNPTTLDARGQGRVLYITGDISPTIEGLRITGGNAVGLYGIPYNGGGGGVYVVTATATICNNQVFSNTANDGGGLYLYRSAATLTGNTITSNTTDYDGGGAYLYESAASLNHNAIVSNIARYGGGLRLYYSDAILNGNTIAYNTALAYLWPQPLHDNVAALSGYTGPASPIQFGGGGLFLADSAAALNGNIVIANTSHHGGGGLYLFRSDATLTNNIIADNHASDVGGLLIWGLSPRLLHNTIARNSSYDGSGVYVIGSILYGTMLSSTVAMTNTILVSQSVGILASADATATLEATLWGAGAWANATDWGGAGRILTGTINVWGDPAFVNPDAGDYHIGPTSAAIDVGVGAGVTSDMDGERRPVGEGYDLGADEFPVALRVTKTATPDPVQAGSQLTYTICITNTGNVTLTATVTDTLPTHILFGASGSSVFPPGGTLNWWPVIPAPGGVWTQTVVVTVETGYTGPLTNVVQVTTLEGATGVYAVTVNNPLKVYLPLIVSMPITNITNLQAGQRVTLPIP